jgi:hypothetical protein
MFIMLKLLDKIGDKWQDYPNYHGQFLEK